MRKTMLAFAGASALALGSAAGAAVVVTGSTNLNNPVPTVVTVNDTTTINFGANPAASPTFTGGFTFTNDVAGLYSVLISSSDPGVAFTSGTLTGPSGSFTLTPGMLGAFSVLSLQPTQIGADGFNLTFAGNNPVAGGSFAGTVTIRPAVPAAVPEPATWGMMLLGFGAMGLVVRRRRHSALAQLA